MRPGLVCFYEVLSLRDSHRVPVAGLVRLGSMT